MILVVRSHAVRALLALPLLSLPVNSQASGFAIDDQGARITGLGGACVAQATDASTIHCNAAGIAFLKGRQLYGSIVLGGRSTELTGAGPFPSKDTLESSLQTPGLLPAAYYTQALGERLVVGIGGGRLYAFRNQWETPPPPDTQPTSNAQQPLTPQQTTARFICLDCEAGAWAVRPTVSVKLADRFAVGGGLDILLSGFNLTRRLIASPNPFPVPTDVAQLSLEGSTTPALGWNVGVLALPSETVSVGLAYRHEVAVTHDAQARFAQVRTGTKEVDDAVAASLPAEQPAEVGFTYPARLSAGLAWRGDRLTLEADLARTFWSDFSQVTLSFRSSTYDTVLPQNFADAWTASLGAEYALREEWDLRGGYSLDTSPQPDRTLSPFLNDSRCHGFSLGASYEREGLRLDLAARLRLRASRATDGRNRYSYEGTYQPGASFSLGASVGYRF